MNAKSLKIVEPSRAVAKRAPRKVQQAGPSDPMMSMLQAAVDQNFDVEKLTKLIDLKNAEIARAAKVEFDRHFAEMQARFGDVSAQRSKQGHNYKYAPIEILQKAYGPVIADCGFSYRWREEAIENGGKRCIMTISGWGHSQDNWFDIPKLDGTAQMNAVQIVGAMSTYGQRYTFKAGFGIVIEDEDNDGTVEDGITYGEQVKLIRESNTLEELRANTKLALTGLEKDQHGRTFLNLYYEKRKKELLK